VALDQFKHKFPGHNFKLIRLDHRGNTRRSLGNFKKVMDDPNGLVVFAGLHSPPLITNNDFINNNSILTLVPWAAGGPITRSKVKENWIYRLSVDDAQAGGFIANYAVNKEGCKKPYLVLENTPWGKSNDKNMTQGLKELKKKPYGKQLFGWGISKASSSKIAETIKGSESDCIFFVGNGKDAGTIFKSFGDAGIKKTIYSHWGVTGGNNQTMANIINSAKLNVKIIQTNFSFLQQKMNPFQLKIKNEIIVKNSFKSEYEIRPMSGWVHSFDLSSIFLNALSVVDLKADILTIRKELKKTLNNMPKKTMGLIRGYKAPFSENNKVEKNNHEALGAKDYIMLKYDRRGNLR
jgi:branched-chain amino acid transport system substrate-binding protein